VEASQLSAHQETRYQCDRCDVDEVVSAENTGPPNKRIAGPEDWLMLRIGADPSTPPSHLCINCAEDFKRFMGEEGKDG